MYNNNQPPSQNFMAATYPYPPPAQPGERNRLPYFGPDGQQQPGYQSQQSDWYMQQHQQQPPAVGPSNDYATSSSYQPDGGYPQPPSAEASSNSGPGSSSFKSPFSPRLSANDTPESSRPQGEKSLGTTKKKRKKGKDDAMSPSPEGQEKEKRTKTGRACDACRTKKIRCDILPPEEVDGHGQPLCAHCKQSGTECTFFMPITETRFKKKRPTEEQTPLPTDSVSLGNHILQHEPPPLKKPRDVPDRIEGPTSLSFLLHTSLPASASEMYDLREHSKWEIIDDGNGVIRISAPPTAGRPNPESDDPTRGHERLNKPILNTQILSLLVNAYFDHIAPMFPIISRAEFTAKGNPSPFLLYAICGVGATRRQFPREVFAGVRGVINGLLRSNDILSDARFENVQALLLLGQVGDLHAQPNAATASASLIRTATAIRMAQDIGLHREATSRPGTVRDVAYVELRRRVWATCVILDRWYAAALGIPQIIDLLDCDVLLPAPYEVVPDGDNISWSINPSYLALTEHLKLSILIGRTLKTHYSPTGLTHTTDAQLEALSADIAAWRKNLPDELKFIGPSSSLAAGLLHMSHAALQFLFWRVFMRMQYKCPPHLNIRLEDDTWNAIVGWSTESIQWLSHNDEALDTLFIYPYTATSCALIQYHDWARRRTDQAVEMLKMIKDTATHWEKIVQPDQMSIRRKTCETMTLLYDAALKTNPEVEEQNDRPAHINPTVGVEPRKDIGRTFWVKDASREGGGIWAALTEADRRDAGLSPKECLLEKDLIPGSDQARQFAVAKRQDFGKHPIDGYRTAQTNGDVIARGNEVPPSSLRSDGLTRDREQYEKGQGAAASQVMAQEQVQNQDQQFLHGTTSNGFMDYFQDMNNATNLNPQLNTEDGMSMGINGHAGTFESTAMDFTVLDGLPMASFDFPSWEQYFQAINQ